MMPQLTEVCSRPERDRKTPACLTDGQWEIHQGGIQAAHEEDEDSDTNKARSRQRETISQLLPG